ncbi:class I SAM-dependent methyltransferase [Streptomyces globosus]|uniref:class I SAM-dependent methyltransferase n=1 Tax=Streptomyces globosus TaxID=68209 RepID=UPI003640F34A
MQQQQYDGIGEAFEGFKSLPLIRHGEVPSFLGMVGDVSGRSILDVACGTGFYSREFKRRGAADVFGVDISAEMIAAARRIEEQEPLGVRYAVGDAAGLGRLERPFDIALAVQCLNYASDIAEMERMCRNIHRNLVPGGELFVFAQKPDYRFDCRSLPAYGFRCEPTGEEREAARSYGSPRSSTRSRSAFSARCRAARSTRSACGGSDSATWSGCRCGCPRRASPSTGRTSGPTSSRTRRWRCSAAGPDPRTPATAPGVRGPFSGTRPV